MKIKNKKIIKKISFYTLISVLLIIAIFGVPLMINKLYQAKNGYYTLWEAKDILSFYSVILSGIITFIALYITIIYSNQSVKKQIQNAMSLTNQPFFIILDVKQQNSPSKMVKNELGYWSKLLNLKNNNQLYNADKGLVCLELKNIGDGIALSTQYKVSMFAGESALQNFAIKSDQVFSINYDLNKNINDKYVKSYLFSGKYIKTFFSRINIFYQNTLGIKYSQVIEISIEEKKEKQIEVIINQISPQTIDDSCNEN